MAYWIGKVLDGQPLGRVLGGLVLVLGQDCTQGLYICIITRILNDHLSKFEKQEDQVL